MNASGAPWRMLEEPAGDAGRSESDHPTQRVQGSAGPDPEQVRFDSALAGPGLRHVAVIGGFALATALGILALLIAVAPTGGSVELDPAARSSIEAGSSSSGAGASSAAAAAAYPAPEGQLIVDVGGAVLRPGVYHLPPGARVADAITAAGGYGPRLDTARASIELNLAAPLTDGQQIRVPSRDDPSRSVSTDGPGQASSKPGDQGAAPRGLVNINTASSSELDALPGIGPVTAAKIIAAREEQPFTALDELTTRKVMGRATLDKLRALLTVR